MHNKAIILSYLFFIGFFCQLVELSAQVVHKDSFYLSEEIKPNLTIHEGLLCQDSISLSVIRNGAVVATINISDPIIVAQAEKEEKWGYFQFPIIFRDEKGRLIVAWQMAEDSHTSYGKGGNGYAMSNDNGRTWEALDDKPFIRSRRRLEYQNGDILQERTPATKSVNDYSEFPRPVNSQSIDGYDFYYEKDLPEELRGVYLKFWNHESKETSFIHASIDDDPLLLRCSINGQIPVVWWGDIRQLVDGSLIAGVYGGHYQNSKGVVLNSAVSFYKSLDAGNTWEALSHILYPEKKGEEMIPFNKRKGFFEPAFEVLNNGTLMCVMRSGNDTPLYRTFSKDKGKHWSTPEAFTPNGVMPLFQKLDNGVLVLASGRPGMQLRFCLDGEGEKWTEPIEMLPFMNEKEQYDVWGVTCGYPSLLKTGENSFSIVYSDFRTKNADGENRKAIMYRRIDVVK